MGRGLHVRLCTCSAVTVVGSDFLEVGFLNKTRLSGAKNTFEKFTDFVCMNLDVHGGVTGSL
jgi:hypothetical protein